MRVVKEGGREGGATLFFVYVRNISISILGERERVNGTGHETGGSIAQCILECSSLYRQYTVNMQNHLIVLHIIIVYMYLVFSSRINASAKIEPKI